MHGDAKITRVFYRFREKVLVLRRDSGDWEHYAVYNAPRQTDVNKELIIQFCRESPTFAAQFIALHKEEMDRPFNHGLRSKLYVASSQSELIGDSERAENVWMLTALPSPEDRLIREACKVAGVQFAYVPEDGMRIGLG